MVPCEVEGDGAMKVGEGVVASPVGGDVVSADEANEVAASPGGLLNTSAEVGEGVVASPGGGDVISADEASEVAASPDVLLDASAAAVVVAVAVAVILFTSTSVVAINNGAIVDDEGAVPVDSARMVEESASTEPCVSSTIAASAGNNRMPIMCAATVVRAVGKP